jgi:hypothetical protein
MSKKPKREQESPTCVRLSTDTRKLLAKLAKASKSTASDVHRNALDLGLARLAKTYNVA